MSEADRGCADRYRHMAHEYAQKRMHMVYATEFVEVSGGHGDWQPTQPVSTATPFCRVIHGNAGAIRHRDNVSWYTPPEERADGGFSTRLVTHYGLCGRPGRREPSTFVFFALRLILVPPMSSSQARNCRTCRFLHRSGHRWWRYQRVFLCS